MIAPLRLFETLRRLRFSQIAGRLWVRAYRPAPDRRPPPDLRLPRQALEPGPVRTARMTGPARVRFLSVEADIAAPQIWNDHSKPALWLYNLHYFDDLVADGAAGRRDWQRALMARWMAENPPATGMGWEPYPTSLRIVNWIKGHLAGATLNAAAIENLAVQVRWLRQRLEFHILGNHLLANAKALYLAGLFFEGEEAENWLKTGGTLLMRQVREQILADGGHFELSPMYHLIVAEDLLDCVALAEAFGVPPPAGLADVAAKTLAWSEALQHPDGDIPFFNDAAFDIAPRPAELRAYAARLGLAPAPLPDIQKLVAGAGYARIDVGRARLFADVASIGPDDQPGHAHADTLSFELSLDGQRLLVNGGTSEYGTGAERLRQRGSAAHNTLVVDGGNSSDVWSGFRVGRRARILDRQASEANGTETLTGAHDGYAGLAGRPVHRRTWTLTPGGLTIADRVDGHGRHRLEIFCHLHPDIEATSDANGVLLRLPGGKVVRASTPDPHPLHIVADTWHPRFGAGVASRMLYVIAEADLPWDFRLEFAWGEWGA